MEYMENQMDNLIQQGVEMREAFDEWLFEVCELKAGKYKDSHDIYPTIDLRDAKCAFIDGMLAEEYIKTL
jgi:hypothetical protein